MRFETSRLPVRILRGSDQGVQLRAIHGDETSEADIGPLLDRIDIQVEVPRFEYQKHGDERLGEASQVICARVQAARQRQWQRFGGEPLDETADAAGSDRGR
jgi:predicted ATPase with chaperone activity